MAPIRNRRHKKNKAACDDKDDPPPPTLINNADIMNSADSHLSTWVELQRRLSEEIEKRMKLQTKLDGVRRMHEFYAHRTAKLEEKLLLLSEDHQFTNSSSHHSNKQQQQDLQEEEEADSNFIYNHDLPPMSSSSSRCDVTCRSCERRTANMVFLPCNHLSICSDCHLTTPACPICNVHRITCFIVQWI